MEPKQLATLITSLISQVLLSLFLPFPLSNPTPNPPLLSLLHLISASEIAAAASLLSRKRKRDRSSQDPSPPTSLMLSKPSLDPFKLSFGMSSSTFEYLSGLLDPLLDSRELAGPKRLAIALSRLAGGDPYPQIASRFNVSEPTARSCTKRLCRVLCTNFRFFLAFPSGSAEIYGISNGFRAISGLDDCCGVIGCERFNLGRSRSVAAQIVVDSSMRILSIAAGFHGERGDGEVLKRSSIYKDVDKGRGLGAGQYFVGGSAYNLLPWLIVPFGEVGNGSVEEEFNGVHGLMYRPLERAVERLRNWGVLGRLLEEEDEKMAVACIGTCAILHNVLITREDGDDVLDLSMESLENVQRCITLEECRDEKKGFELRSTLAMKAREVRNAGQNL